MTKLVSFRNNLENTEAYISVEATDKLNADSFVKENYSKHENCHYTYAERVGFAQLGKTIKRRYSYKVFLK